VQSKVTLVAFRKLQEADWKTIGIRLAAYARWKARNLRWRTGQTDELAKGKTPEDIAAEAIEKVLNGTRVWDPQAKPDLLEYLKGVVDSDLSHLAVSEDNVRQRRLWENEEGEELRDKAEFEALRHDLSGVVTQQPANPEDAAGGSDEDTEEKRIDQLFASVSGDRELTEVLELMLEGETKPQGIAERLQTSVTDIYNRLKRIRRRALKSPASPQGQIRSRGDYDEKTA
jgi:DNA-directed RNA polymerase specialized sigma24 family protein